MDSGRNCGERNCVARPPECPTPQQGALRAHADRSLSQVSRAVGISRTELMAIESGHTMPTVDLLDRIARALGSTIVQVVRGAKRADATASSNARPLGLTEIGRAIADLPTTGSSKVDRAASAAVVFALDASGGNQSAAARLLGMDRKAYVRRLARAQRRARRP
jgi:transcriptional regulator with XRE-family HTH domain